MATPQGTILIAEDSREASKYLGRLLTDNGYGVRQAFDGELALLSAKARAPDLLLLDIRMPLLDGFEVCRRLKADPETAEIPVIFLSGMTDTQAMLEGFRLGAVDYITKPFRAEEILARVKTHLELNLLRRRLESMVQTRTLQLQGEIEERRAAEQRLRVSEQHLRQLTRHLEDVREHERARLARELHDEMGQLLTVLRFDLQRLATFLPPDASDASFVLATLFASIDRISNTARAISEDLRPGMLDVLGLAAAVEHYVKRFAANSDIECDLQMNAAEFDVSPRVATTVFRVLQESLTNVARHAKANRVTVKLVRLDRELLLIVEDNGIGMPMEGMAGKGQDGERHFGILGMRERIALLGGTLELEAEAGQGTRLEASIPYVQEEQLP